MQYTILGNTGLVVSRLSFGAMTFTQGNKDIGAVFKVGAELADQLVGRSLDAGINFLDTADGYAGGESEIQRNIQLYLRSWLAEPNQITIGTERGLIGIGEQNGIGLLKMRATCKLLRFKQQKRMLSLLKGLLVVLHRVTW